MPLNLGEISQLKDGINGLFQIVDSYRKIKYLTLNNDIYLDNLEAYYENSRRILKGIEKNGKKDLQ